MAKVTLTVGGRQYDLNCRDGEENHLTRLSALIDAKVMSAGQSSPALTEIRHLLFASLLLADELHDLRKERDALIREKAELKNAQASLSLPMEDAQTKSQNEEESAAMADFIDSLTSRIESLADRLAGSAPTP